MVKRGELYVIFDIKRGEDEYFYFPVTEKNHHINGVIKCNDEYHLGLDIHEDDLSYVACSKLSCAMNSLVLIVDGRIMCAFIPPVVNRNIYSFCKKYFSFFSKYDMNYVSLYEDMEGQIQEKIVDFDDDELSRSLRVKHFLKEVKGKYKVVEKKTKHI